jgi:hypothetical protein
MLSVCKYNCIKKLKKIRTLIVSLGYAQDKLSEQTKKKEQLTSKN